MIHFADPLAQWAMDFIHRKGGSCKVLDVTAASNVSHWDLVGLMKEGYLSMDFKDKFHEKNCIPDTSGMVRFTEKAWALYADARNGGAR